VDRVGPQRRRLTYFHFPCLPTLLMQDADVLVRLSYVVRHLTAVFKCIFLKLVIEHHEYNHIQLREAL